ncbi:hypothetical protein PsAD13_00374 [Pseudovibrio sp. Ad13]|uniref:hypothetical protein n=1 Tax=Pseudovibrio sp. Ad13 TaxID=989396 RepID=UPI0007AE5AA7|nr:hypothetical protein [Pseudovibrio sp. Ad13]KZK87106.1 hypothetical protein PsAD13_00374 [Pseudovibrio sp. Ad13]
MKIILIVLGAAALGLLPFILRHKSTDTLSGVPENIRLSMRKTKYRKKKGVHVIDSVDDPSILLAVIGLIFAKLSEEDVHRQINSLHAHFKTQYTLPYDIGDLHNVAEWIIAQSGDDVEHMAKQLKYLYPFNDSFWPVLDNVLHSTRDGTQGEFNSKQQHLRSKLKIIFDNHAKLEENRPTVQA